VRGLTTRCGLAGGSEWLPQRSANFGRSRGGQQSYSQCPAIATRENCQANASAAAMVRHPSRIAAISSSSTSPTSVNACSAELAGVGFPAASSSTGSGWLKQRWRISLNACWSNARRCVRVWPGRRLRSLSIMTVASLRRAASAVGWSSSMPANVASPPGAANGTQPLQANTFI
jgi:hypothetical protein